VRDADQILVVQDGRVVERGKHDALLARNGLYAELYRTQFAREAHGDGIVPADFEVPGAPTAAPTL
jgi:ATP-binding cassette subfamily B protein